MGHPYANVRLKKKEKKKETKSTKTTTTTTTPLSFQINSTGQYLLPLLTVCKMQKIDAHTGLIKVC